MFEFYSTCIGRRRVGCKGDVRKELRGQSGLSQNIVFTLGAGLLDKCPTSPSRSSQAHLCTGMISANTWFNLRSLRTEVHNLD